MWVIDRETLRFLAVNSAMLGHYGYSADEFDRTGLATIFPPGVIPRPDLPGAHQHRKKDGTIIDVELAIHEITFRGRGARLVLATDVTEHNRARAALVRQAHSDSLTGLPNRASFRSSLGRAIGQSCRTSEGFALFLMDLDRFKAINDAMGHAYGDEALQQIGPRLGEVLRPGDILARLGGDEFGVLLPGAEVTDALRIARRLLEAFREPFVFDGRPFDLGSSVGIAIHPAHGDDVDVLLHRADLAMYASKRSKAGAVLYTPALEGPSTPQGMAGPPQEWDLSLAGRISNDRGYHLDR
jgi:diguanylate cyclase (GGDEF)-like protein